MKKTLLLILMLVNIFILYACKANFDFDFQVPDIEQYKINELSFNQYSPSLILEYSDIDEESLSKATQANVLIRNISYNDEWSFTEKNGYAGSGVIFYETEDFYFALTNAHVIDKEKDYEYNLLEVYDYFENKYNAFIYEKSVDYELDLAIIVFYKTEVVLTVLDILDGYIEVNNNVIAIGNPLGVKNVITNGVVLRYNKTRTEDRYGELQTHEFLSIIHSALTNSGSSGGMLLNYDLKIVGIHYGGNNDDNNPEGFSIPSAMIVDYLEFLIRY